MAEHELPIADDLLGLGEVGHVARVVDAPGEVPGSLLAVRSPGNQGIGQVVVGSELGVELLDVALDDGPAPAAQVHVGQGAHQALVEDELVVELPLLLVLVHYVEVVGGVEPIVVREVVVPLLE